MSSGPDIPVTLRLTRIQDGSSFSETRDALAGLSQGLQDSSRSALTERESLLSRRSAIQENVRVQRLFRNEFREQHELFLTSTRLVGQVGNAFLKINQIYVNHNLLQQRQTELDERLRIAKEKLAVAIRDGGTETLASQSAQANVNRLLNDQANLAHEATVQYITMGVAASSVTGDIAQAIQTAAYAGFLLRERGGISGVLSRAFGRGPGAAPLVGSATPLGGVSREIPAAAGGGFSALLSAIAAPAAAFVAGAIGGLSLQEAGLGAPREAGRGFLEENAPWLDPRTWFGLQPESSGGGDMIVQGNVIVYPQGARSGEIIEQVTRSTRTRQRVTPPPT